MQPRVSEGRIVLLGEQSGVLTGDVADAFMSLCALCVRKLASELLCES